jgi:VWFA-related protein
VRASFAAANAADDRSHLSRRAELLVDRRRRTGARLRTARVAAFAAALAAVACLVGRTPALVAFGGPRTAMAVAAIPRAEQVEETKMNRRTMAMAAVALTAVASAPVVAQQEAKPAVVEPAAPQTRLVVLYLDLTAMSKEDLAGAVSSAKKFLETRRGGTQQVALISYNGRSVWVGEDFTGDFDRLEKTLDQLQASGGSAVAASDADRAKALEQAVGMLATLPEKKALVWFTRPPAASRDQLAGAINAAIRANVGMFPIDVRGITAGQGK